MKGALRPMPAAGLPVCRLTQASTYIQTCALPWLILTKPPAEAQISLLKAMIKAIDVFEDHVILRMYVTDPSDELTCTIPPEKGKTLYHTATGTEQGSPECQQWRRGWDSNPRYPFGYTHFPGVLLQPLGHLSNIAPASAGSSRQNSGSEG